MPKPLLLSEIVLTDDQVQAIGALAVESAALERLAELLVWIVSGIDIQIGHIFTDRLQLDARMELLRNAVKEKFADDHARLAKFKLAYDNIKDAIPKRNVVIHGVWIPPGPFKEDGPSVATKRGRTTAIVATEVNDLARRFHGFRDDLWACFEDLVHGGALSGKGG